MLRLNITRICLTLLPFAILLLWLGLRPDKNTERLNSYSSPKSLTDRLAYDNSSRETPDFNPNHKIVFPLVFPIKGMKFDIIKNIPDSRFPGAPRLYRGVNATHMGVDLYTGKCGLEVVSPASGWIISISSFEEFPDSRTRDSILKITEKAGFTPEPVLSNLHGISVVVFHGWNDAGEGFYSRLSHLERLSSNFKVGDFVNRGQILGYVGATGTSAQFKTGKEKESGCHLHFEWHVLKGGKDTILGLKENDFSAKRNLYLQLFSP